MKLPTIVTIVVVILGASWVGWNARQLAESRANHEALVAEATLRGITLEPDADRVRLRASQRPRVDKDAKALTAAADFIAFAREAEEMTKNGGHQGAAAQKRLAELMERMLSLNESQLKIVIAEFSSCGELGDEIRQELLSVSMMTLAEKRPQAALALLAGSADLMNDGGVKEQIVASSLGRWAKDDPLGALDWARKNAEKTPGSLSEDVKRGLIGGAATQNPKLAFEWVGELGVKNPSQLYAEIAGVAKTATERTATLGALRDYLANRQDEVGRENIADAVVKRLAGTAMQEGFAAASGWLASAGLTDKELARFASGLSGAGGSAKSSEAGQWVEWIGMNLPTGQADQSIQNLVKGWTQNDYIAAGQWLTSMSDGPTKDSAVRSYAVTVARYDPECAGQWAMTLPPSNDRDVTLNRIYQNWPKDDPASKQAAELFAELHGIK